MILLSEHFFLVEYKEKSYGKVLTKSVSSRRSKLAYHNDISYMLHIYTKRQQ